jgi:hypothetical protein
MKKIFKAAHGIVLKRSACVEVIGYSKEGGINKSHD